MHPIYTKTTTTRGGGYTKVLPLTLSSLLKVIIAGVIEIRGGESGRLEDKHEWRKVQTISTILKLLFSTSFTPQGRWE